MDEATGEVINNNFGQIVVPGGFDSDFTFTFVRSGGSPDSPADRVDPFDFRFYINDLDHGRRENATETFQMYGYDSCLLAGSSRSSLATGSVNLSSSYDVGLTSNALMDGTVDSVIGSLWSEQISTVAHSVVRACGLPVDGGLQTPRLTLIPSETTRSALDLPMAGTRRR